MIKSLQQITKDILGAEKDTSKAAVIRLFDFYKQFPLSSNDLKDVQLSYGFALCEQYAADCILDYKRTCSFIKGIYKAINDVLASNKGGKVHILYAGCGPYAPLLIPILNLLRDDRLYITFIDINQSSVNELQTVVNTLSLNIFIESTKVADAITYQHPRKLDLIITETMFLALTREPQVAIAQNLMPQLKENGILIPEEISINLGYSDTKKEPRLQCLPNNYSIKGDLLFQPKKDLVELLKIEKGMRYSETKERPFFETEWINIENIEEYDSNIMLYTALKVYKEETLLKAESNITNPLCIGSLTNLKEEKSFKLKYTITKEPKWQIEYK